MNRGAQSWMSLGLLVLVGATTACRSHVGMISQYNTTMRPLMLGGDWAGAVAAMDAAKKDGVYKEDDRVMYWLNRGTFLYYAGNYAASQQDFVQAEASMRELWTKSVSNEAKKYISNETGGPYGGEDFEKVMVYYYTALNMLQQNRAGDALVEARRADELLKTMEVHYNKEGGPGTIYRQDAFMLWVVGMLYEMEGSYGDAYLAYVASWKAYQSEYAKRFGVSAPSFLPEDIYRTGVLAGRGDDAPPGATKTTVDALQQGMAEIILLHGAGEAPQKREKTVTETLPDGYVLHVALPEFRRRPAQILQAEAEIQGVKIATMPVEPIEVIAFRNYDHQIGTITARAIARATAKYLAAKAAEAAGKAAGGKDKDKGALIGALAGLVVNVAAAASEAADLRAWMALPAVINATRFWVPAGTQELTLRFRNRDGSYSPRQETLQLDLKPGQRKVINVRTVL